MKKINVMFFCVLLILSLIFGGDNTVQARSSPRNYYKVLPGDEEWNSLTSIEEKIEICRIDTAFLKEMNIEEVLQAVLDFPFVWCLFFYDDFSRGVKQLEIISDAYKELRERPEALDAILTKIEELKEKNGRSEDTQALIDIDRLCTILLFDELFQYSLTQEDYFNVVNSSTLFFQTEDEINAALSNIYTPAGSLVTHTHPTCNHNALWHEMQDDAIVLSSGVVKISNGTCRYNCHSYAWYSVSTSNTVWIENPSKYMSDGSYFRVHSGTTPPTNGVHYGDVVFYNSGDSNKRHSAILKSNASSSPLATLNCYSKWGIYGVFSHTVGNIQALVVDTGDLSVWHRSSLY